MTPAQARERKVRLTAICLAVVFVIVAAIQGPGLLKSLHKSPAGAATAAPDSRAASTEPSGATQAAGTIPVPGAGAGTLTSFSRFRLGDPFHAQVAVSATGATTATAATTPAVTAKAAPKAKPAPEAKPVPPRPIAPAPPVPFTVAPTPVAPTPVEPPDAALITLNGKRQVVLVGAGFPIGEPLFKLVALGKKDVKIGVLGGSFTSGAPTLALLRGRAITLADEVDGSRYVLRLVRLTTSAAPAQPTAAAAAAPSAG